MRSNLRAAKSAPVWIATPILRCAICSAFRRPATRGGYSRGDGFRETRYLGMTVGPREEGNEISGADRA